MILTSTPRQRGRFTPLLVALATLGACSGPQTSKPAGLLGYGTPGVSTLGQGTPAATLQEELDRCSSISHAGAASQAPGLPAACSQLQRTVRNQPGNTVR